MNIEAEKIIEKGREEQKHCEQIGQYNEGKVIHSTVIEMDKLYTRIFNKSNLSNTFAARNSRLIVELDVTHNKIGEII